MSEPTTFAAGVIATASTVTLAILGVDYYSLIWAMVGALLALYQAEKMGRIRSVLFVVLSTLIGAALGTVSAVGLQRMAPTLFTELRPLLIAASLIAGFGAQLIVTALLRASLSRIGRLGGDAPSDSHSGGQ